VVVFAGDSFPQASGLASVLSSGKSLQSRLRRAISMRKIIIVVGSTRRPKLGAVSEALEIIGPLLAPEAEIEVTGRDVESGVGHTPASREELMRGARQRAEALVNLAKESGEAASYFVGLEGGLEISQENGMRRVFLESWAYVSNGQSGYFGRSGGVELPEALAHEVLEGGTELSEAIDRFAGEVGIRDAQGAWGVLSANQITRQEAFRVAIIAAFAPFYNAKMYRRAEAAKR
jgi:inosine/xanthosine triphosphatase